MCFLFWLACNTWLGLSGNLDLAAAFAPTAATEEESSIPPPPRPVPAAPLESNGNLKTVVYPVSEILDPEDDAKPCVLPKLLAIADPAHTKAHLAEPPEEMLIELITKTVAPESWAQMGGPGTIAVYPLGMSLVIKQTPEIHAMIGDMLQALRKVQNQGDQQYVLELRLIEVQPDGQPKVLTFPRITVFQERWFKVFMGKTLTLKEGSIQDLLHGAPVLDSASRADKEDATPEEVQVGLLVRGRVAAPQGKVVRLDLVMQKNDLDAASREDIVVVGNFLRTAQRVRLGQVFERVLQENDEGEPSVWLEVTVKTMDDE